MTTRTILLTLAASLAPLYAQQSATPVDAAQLFTRLAAPVAASHAATPEQRAQVFSALALLPQDIADFAVLTHVGDNLVHLAESKKLAELDAGDIPAELQALDNIAIATSHASPASYALLQHVLVNLSTVGSTLELAEKWTSEARNALDDSIMEALLLRADATSILPESAADGTHIPASYIIITSKSGEEAVLQKYGQHLLADFQDASRPGVTLEEYAHGFSGIRMNVAEAYRAELEEATRDMAPRRKAQLLEALAKHPLHLLARQQGNALIIALCENPQELRLAATPAESLLATDKLAACDVNLERGMIAAARVSPELAAIVQATNTQPTLHLANGISTVFTRLAEEEPVNKDAYAKAAAAINYLSTEFQKLTRPITRPSFMQVWCDGDLHLLSTSDAQGCSYSPGTLRLATLANAPKTSLYAESTPILPGLEQPDSKALLEAALNAAEGFALTLDASKRQQADAAFTTIKAFLPELQSIASAACTISNGLDGQVAFVMDSALAPIPAVPSVQPGLLADAPRFVLYAGVKDRSQLDKGWETMKTSAGQIARKLGAPAEIVNLLPITTKQVGSATSYSITLPFFTQDAVPSLAVTHTGLALGSSTNLTVQVANSATGTTPFAGTAFALKFKPLARTLRSLATALDHDAEEAEPAASSEIRLEKEQGVAVASIGGSNSPTTIILSMKAENTEDTADKLSTAAAIFEYASTIAEGVFGTSTIDNGQHTVHMEIKMK